MQPAPAAPLVRGLAASDRASHEDTTRARTARRSPPHTAYPTQTAHASASRRTKRHKDSPRSLERVVKAAVQASAAPPSLRCGNVRARAREPSPQTLPLSAPAPTMLGIRSRTGAAAAAGGGSSSSRIGGISGGGGRMRRVQATSAPEVIGDPSQHALVGMGGFCPGAAHHHTLTLQ
eukprot:313929-Chlamydomonas_euryale.AAC.3